MGDPRQPARARPTAASLTVEEVDAEFERISRALRRRVRRRRAPMPYVGCSPEPRPTSSGCCADWSRAIFARVPWTRRCSMRWRPPPACRWPRSGGRPCSAASTGPVAVAALTEGAAAVEAFGLTVGQPIRPMLAASAPDMTEALTKSGVPASLDVKLDGIRIQVHQSGDEVRVFTRSLDEITSRLPEVCAVARALGRESLILDGEVMTLDATGRPRPFQETASRTATQVGPDAPPVAEGVLTPFFFDILHVDGVDLIDLPLSERLTRLDDVVPADYRIARLTTDDPAAAQDFFTDAVASGQEGVVVKALSAPYDAGRRGSAWVKVKPRHTLDLVVLAVEWGSGRRQGWLSNIHLGARDPDARRFRHARQDVQGHDRRDARLADQALPRARGVATWTRRAAAPCPGRRDRVRRTAEIDPIPGRACPALRPRRALPRRQDAQPRPTPSRRCATSPASGEDAHAPRTDEQADDDQDDAPQHLPTHQRDDSRHDQDHRDVTQRMTSSPTTISTMPRGSASGATPRSQRRPGSPR